MSKVYTITADNINDFQDFIFYSPELKDYTYYQDINFIKGLNVGDIVNIINIYIGINVLLKTTGLSNNKILAYDFKDSHIKVNEKGS